MTLLHRLLRRMLANVAARLHAARSEPAGELRLSLLLLVAVVGFGALGYVGFEGMAVLDALYMTVITLTTVGFREVAPLDTVGKVYTIGLLAVGVGVAAWTVHNAAEVILGRTFWVSVQRRRMKECVMDLRNHYIVCGHGRLGRQIVRDLRVRGESFVILESDSTQETELLQAGLSHLLGDATSDGLLLEAGIEKARGLVAALATDADNVLTVLTARELNPRLLIVSRANSEVIESKLRRAGADRVVTPASIGGHRLALALLRPAVHDFFGRIFAIGQERDVDVGQITIPPDSPFAGQTIAGCDLRRMRSVTILAVRDEAGRFDLNPDAQRTIRPGDTLIVIGPAAEVYDMEALFSPDG